MQDLPEWFAVAPLIEIIYAHQTRNDTLFRHHADCLDLNAAENLPRKFIISHLLVHISVHSKGGTITRKNMKRLGSVILCSSHISKLSILPDDKFPTVKKMYVLECAVMLLFHAVFLA